MSISLKAKRVTSLLLAVIFMLTAFVVPTVSAEPAGDGITVRLHYLRPDGDYTNWTVWMWTDKGEGKAYEFDGTTDDKGAVTTATFTDSPQKIGFIVRLGEWEAKDPDGDRFIEVKDVVAGTIDVYCESGKSDFTVDTSNATTGIKLVKVAADSTTKLSYELSAEDGTPTANDFVITAPTGDAVGIKSVTANGAKGTIELNTEVDYSKAYTVSYKGGPTVYINMPEYFSTKEFEDAYTYEGDDLGASWSSSSTKFRVWAPTADKIELNLYKTGDGNDLIKTVEMKKDVKGTWVAEESGDLNGTYYTYTAYFGDTVNKNIVDPYARTVGVNGKRGMVIDLDSTNPSGWSGDKRKVYANPTDITVYELHIRDFSSDPDSGIKNTGKYLAFTENGTKNSKGTPTGIDHLKDLGITSVHILPSYDYASVDETKLDKEQYNWGYDPQNYNAPEGSYSTDPYKGEVRVNEYKQMVQALHNAGIGVVMDVVYNHTYNTNFSMNLLVPGYYYRPGSNGSGCGNDVASERSMVRKFIADSVAYWASEYHLDGFRFDLMGLEDVDTMNAVKAALNKVDSNIYVYGEGWSLSTITTKPGVTLATQPNSHLTPSIGYFSDNIRDAIKGSVFDAADKGFVNGNSSKAGTIKDGIMGTTSWSPAPTQTINYVSCHDNLTLWDKINSSNGSDSEGSKIKQNLLAAAIVYTSQGVPFIQAGEEFLRTKVTANGTFEHNSYKSPDSVNLLDYSRIDDYKAVYDYYKGLIAFRKYHAALRMTDKADVKANISFLDNTDKGVIAYTIDGAACGDAAEKLLVILNGNTDKDSIVTLPAGNWDIYIQGNKAGNEKIDSASGSVTVAASTATVLLQNYDSSKVVIPAPVGESSVKPDENTSSDTSSEVNSSVDESKTEDSSTEESKTDSSAEESKTDSSTEDSKAESSATDSKDESKAESSKSDSAEESKSDSSTADSTASGSDTDGDGSTNIALIVVIVIIALAAVGTGTFFIIKKVKK